MSIFIKLLENVIKGILEKLFWKLKKKIEKK